MALLLDTQVLIWLEETPERIPERVRDRIFTEPIVYLSQASVWELAIKIKTRKLSLKQPLQTFVVNFLIGYNYKLLNIQLSHIYQTERLALLHKDPFDRLIIAQSLVENLEIVSSDEIFDGYGVKRIWKS